MICISLSTAAETGDFEDDLITAEQRYRGFRGGGYRGYRGYGRGYRGYGGYGGGYGRRRGFRVRFG